MLDHPRRLAKVLYRAPGAADWQEKPLEGWALEVYNGKLYAGTRQEGGNGKVYMSVGSETPGTPPPTSGPVDYIPKGLGIPNAPFAGALPRRRRATTPTPASRGVPERLQRPPSPPLEGTRRG